MAPLLLKKLESCEDFGCFTFCFCFFFWGGGGGGKKFLEPGFIDIISMPNKYRDIVRAEVRNL